MAKLGDVLVEIKEIEYQIDLLQRGINYAKENEEDAIEVDVEDATNIVCTLKRFKNLYNQREVK